MVRIIPSQLLHYATGFAVLVVSCLVLHSESGRDLTVPLASVFLIIIVITDTLFRKIHNLSTSILTLSGVALQIYLHGLPGLWLAALGLLTGLLLLLPFYLFGGMGAGDVKALAALGTVTGFAGILQVFLYTALIGGVLSVLLYCVTTNLWQKSLAGLKALQAFLYIRDFRLLMPDSQGQRQSLPYASAIALGYFSFIKWGEIIGLS